MVLGGKRAEHTHFDRKGDSDGIDDYIAVSGEMTHKTSHLEYWFDMRDLRRFRPLRATV